jgi:hypothetical protein
MDALEAARAWAEGGPAWRTHDHDRSGRLYTEGASFRSQGCRVVDERDYWNTVEGRVDPYDGWGPPRS